MLVLNRVSISTIFFMYVVRCFLSQRLHIIQWTVTCISFIALLKSYKSKKKGFEHCWMCNWKTSYQISLNTGFNSLNGKLNSDQNRWNFHTLDIFHPLLVEWCILCSILADCCKLVVLEKSSLNYDFSVLVFSKHVSRERWIV